MIRKVKEALAFCKGGCWKVDIGAYGFLRRAGVNFVRFFSTTFKSFGAHRCGLHAAGLTYFTILGFVPVLCLLMVCAKTCGLGDKAREAVNSQIEPLIANLEKGKEAAIADAVEVTSLETVAAVTNAAAAVTNAAAVVADAPAVATNIPAVVANVPAVVSNAPAAAANAATSGTNMVAAAANGDGPPKEDEAATAAAAQKKDEPALIDVVEKAVEVTASGEDEKDIKKKKEALYKVQASKELEAQIRKFSNEMFDRIDKVDLTTLGWIGFAVLMWTVVSTLGHVETAVNEVWHVKTHRPIWRKFIVYLFVVVILPIFMSLAVSLPILRLLKTMLNQLKAMLDTATYTSWVGKILDNPYMTRWVWDPLDTLLMSQLFSFSITLTFSSLAFAVLLKMMPNRRVRFRSAFYAGIFTAVLVGGWMMLCTTAGVGIAKSGAMYGSFAAVPIVLAWIYMSWQIVLLGSCMSYAFECVHRRSPELSDR